MIKVIGIRFRNSGKVYYFDPQDLPLRNGGKVIVETARGLECGSVVLSPRDVSEEHVVQPLRPILRLATEQDLEQEKENRRKEEEAHRVCQQKIAEHNLEMKLIKSEYTFDRKKLLFYFTAEGRVDFRDLVKDLAAVFKTRIELRQIGVRDETKILGGIGICGRPLCCSTYLSDFSSVSIKMAKEQNLSLNPTKISGACGRLMCCLKNEQETYEYLNKNLPGIGDIVEISAEEGEEARTGEVQTVNVLRQNARVLIEVGDDKEIIEVPAERMEVIMTRRKKNKERAKERERLSKEKKEKEKLKAQGEPEAEIQETIEPEEKAERRQKKEHAGKRDRAEKPKRAEIRAEADSQGAAEQTERTDVKPEEDGQEKGGKTHRREGRRSRRSRRDGNRRQAENKPSENPPAQ